MRCDSGGGPLCKYRHQGEARNGLVEIGGNTLINDKVQLDARLSWTKGYDRWPYSINMKSYNPNPIASARRRTRKGLLFPIQNEFFDRDYLLGLRLNFS